MFLERTKYRIRVGRGLAPAAGFAVNYGTGKLKCERRGATTRRPVCRGDSRIARRFLYDFAEQHGGYSLLVGANCVRPPNCHSEPTGEESRFAHFILGFEILRFAQDDKLEYVGANAFRA